MSKITHNLVANYLGQAWCAVMGLAFIPYYIEYLGMEAYGLIGFFAMMQAWLVLLDMGMTPTLNREMARYTSGIHSRQFIRDLLRTLEIIYFSIAFLIIISMWFASSYFANDWFKLEKLTTEVVSQAIIVMGIVIALRLLEGIYRSSLLGLQRHVWFNAVNVVLSTIRHAGAYAVLIWVSPTIQAFFLWQVFVSLLSVLILAASTNRILPKAALNPKFSQEALSSIWKFAGGMMMFTVFAIILTQVDKLLLSRFLTLETFGYYTLSATVAAVLYMAIGPITQAIYPRMVELSTAESNAGLKLVYHKGAQLVTIITAPMGLLLSFFSGGVIFMWSGNTNLAENTAPILSALALGNFLGGLRWMPHDCQLSHGWTSLTVKLNMAAVIVFIPSILWILPRFGAIGVAWLWVAMNIVHGLLEIHFMHKRLISGEKWRWFFKDVFLPTAGTIGVMLTAQQLQPESYQDRWHWVAFLLITGCIAILVSTVLADKIRPRLLSIIRRTFCWQYS